MATTEQIDSDDDNFHDFDSTTETRTKSASRHHGSVTVLDELDSWSFDVFLLADSCDQRPLVMLGQTLFNRYGFLQIFHLPQAKVGAFLKRIEDGYGNNDYHNSIHASSVTHVMHYFLSSLGLKNYLSSLEVFASLFAAMIHDYNHDGLTNKFLITTGADKAVLYNDRSVQENHHLSASFFILKDPECSMLEELTQEEYRNFRTMVIDMVLCTDMAFHFQMLKEMKVRLNDQSPIKEKVKVMSFMLHTSDLAFSSQRWSLNTRWVGRLFKEFFKQGDLEKELGLPVSPMCDRENTLVPESQIHWIEYIVEPTITTCGNVIERILNDESSDASDLEAVLMSIDKPWVECIRENKQIWKNKIMQGNTNLGTSSKHRKKSV